MTGQWRKMVPPSWAVTFVSESANSGSAGSSGSRKPDGWFSRRKGSEKRAIYEIVCYYFFLGTFWVLAES